MPRPRRMRRVRFGVNVDYFKPRGVPVSSLNVVELNIEELEAIRLYDYEGTDQTEAAKKMNVSQPTFHRILSSARKKIAEALVNGKAIQIQGGVYKMPGGDGTGPRAQGRGMGQRGFGGPTVCRCPECGTTAAHVRGQPCVKQKCPECGSMMIRGDQ